MYGQKRPHLSFAAKSMILTIRLLMLILVVSYGFAYAQANQAQAASLSTLSDNLSRLAASTLSDHTIQFITPSGVTALSQTVTINFNSFTSVTNVTPTDVKINVSSSTSCTSFSARTDASSAGSNIWGVGTSGTTLTLTAPSSGTIGTSGVPVGNCLQVLVGSNAGGTTRITNPAAGAATITIGGTFGDTGTIAVPIISNDQVALSATVNPTISFALSQNTLGFGTLTAANGRWATNSGGSATAATSLTATVGTNAASGYAVYVQGPTLTSGSNTIAALGSATASTPGTAQFGLNVAVGTTGAGAPVATAPYSTASQYAWTATSSAQTQIASNNAPDSGSIFNLSYLANISALTPAGTYAATHTYTATGNF